MTVAPTPHRDLGPIEVRFRLVGSASRAKGLLGFVTLRLFDLLLVEDVAVRRTRDGRLALSFPVRHGRTGREHALVHPCDAAARAAIEREVFARIEHLLPNHCDAPAADEGDATASPPTARSHISPFRAARVRGATSRNQDEEPTT